MHNYRKYPDQDLLSRIRNDNDEEAYTELYNRYWKIMYSQIVRKLNSTEIAEDLVQDIFADIWRRRQVINFQSSFAAYLSVAVKYKVINAQARKYRERYFQEQQKHTFEYSSNTVDQYLSFEELRKKLEQQLALLPEKCGLSFKLCREDGLSQKEAADQMHTTPKAIERNIYRAIKSLSVSMRHFIYDRSKETGSFVK